MGEPSAIPGLDPARLRWVLGGLAILACGLLAMVPVSGIDPVTGARTPPAPGQASAERAVAALEEIAAAQSVLRKDTDGDGVVEYGTLADLQAAGLLEGDLARGRLDGYVLEVRPSPTRPEFAWIATATPEPGSPPGAPTFVVNHEGLVHALRGPLALDDGCAIPTSATRVGR